jgi:hypothetical protein
MLVGNKLDKAKTTAREVEESVAADFAKSHGLLFKEASALSDTNVTTAFEDLLTYIDEDKSKMSKGNKRPTGNRLGQDINNQYSEDEETGCSC